MSIRLSREKINYLSRKILEALFEDDEVEFLDEPIDKLSPDAVVRRGISLCPEGRRVWPD